MPTSHFIRTVTKTLGLRRARVEQVRYALPCWSHRLSRQAGVRR
jgi:hypothetical protein